MRWKQPPIGTTIWKKRFAFFPKTISKTTVWFEFYYTCSIFHDNNWNGTNWIHIDLLPEFKEVQDYLFSISPLGKAMTENDDEI